jgi:hypothetical protein
MTSNREVVDNRAAIRVFETGSSIPKEKETMNQNRNRWTFWMLPVVGFLALMAPPAGAQPAALAQPNVAAMSIQGGGVSFAPVTGLQPMTLRVQGGDFVSTESVRPGQTAWFAPVDGDGYQLPDGAYNWEITETAELSRSAVGLSSRDEAPAHGRSVQAVPAATPGRVQSGTFTIENGVIVDSRLIEAPAARTAVAEIAVSSRSAADEFAERAARMDDGIVVQRAVRQTSQITGPPSAAARAAEHRDQDGN